MSLYIICSHLSSLEIFIDRCWHGLYKLNQGRGQEGVLLSPVTWSKLVLSEGSAPSLWELKIRTAELSCRIKEYFLWIKKLNLLWYEWLLSLFTLMEQTWETKCIALFSSSKFLKKMFYPVQLKICILVYFPSKPKNSIPLNSITGLELSGFLFLTCNNFNIIGAF